MDFNKPGVQIFLGSVVRPGTHKGPAAQPSHPVPLHLRDAAPPLSDGAVLVRVRQGAM